MLRNSATHQKSPNGSAPLRTPASFGLAQQLIGCKDQKQHFVVLTMVIACCLVIRWTSLGSAQESPPNEPLSSAEQPSDPITPIELTDLPKPPQSIADLLARASVTFSTGPRQPQSRPQATLRGERFQIAAETEFKMSYRYRSDTRWHVRLNRQSRLHGEPREPERVLMIRVQIRELNMKTIHHIWFRDHPSDREFWENPLVLHELDHVMISANPALSYLFHSKAKKLSTIEYPLSPAQRPSDALVRKIVDEKMEAIFHEVSDLASIRYAELDRVTRHGQDPLPPRYRQSKWFTRER